MKVLAIDTSTMMSSICILDNDIILGEFNINQEETHSEKLAPMIKRLLEDIKININDIDLFAVANGPGSFTGLRIGVTTLKAISQALEKPIIGVSTLEAMAYSILTDDYILPIIDGRGNRYFSGLYFWQEDKLIKEFEDILEHEILIDRLKNKKVVVVGEAIKKMSKNIDNSNNIKFAHIGLSNGIARNVAIIAKQRYLDADDKQIFYGFDLSPNYLRKSQAEISLKNENI